MTSDVLLIIARFFLAVKTVSSIDNDEEPSPEEIEEMFDVLMQTSDAEFQQMPQELVNMLYSLAEAGVLPEELEQRVRKLFLRKQK